MAYFYGKLKVNSTDMDPTGGMLRFNFGGFVPPGTIPSDIYMWRAFSAVSPSMQPTEKGPHARAKVVYHEDATDSAPNATKTGELWMT